MIKISHRGNLNGSIKSQENSPKQIIKVLEKGYDCEIDVWYVNGEVVLAHSLKEDVNHKVNDDFLRKKGLWCHAKNLDALRIMLTLRIHCFWHQEDDYTVTSEGWIWAYPGNPGNTKTIAVMPEWNDTDVTGYGGVCSDYIQNYVEK